MKPRDVYHKGKIDQLICDIEENEWFCEQGESQSQMEDWEKVLIVEGLKKILLEGENK